MNREYYDKIADLMLFCINFSEGEKLNIGLNHDCREAAKSLVYKAYERGASFVGLRYIDDFINAAAIKAGKKSVEYPEYFTAGLSEICGPGW
jgi:leucyl aminopeptidase (aminopeptidase T)